MPGKRVLGAAMLLGCAAQLSCSGAEPIAETSRLQTHTVRMEGMGFLPVVITAKPGDIIVWINKDLVPHTATSAVAGFDSEVIAANGSWRHRVQQTGDFDYVCSFHPTMTGKLKVER